MEKMEGMEMMEEIQVAVSIHIIKEMVSVMMKTTTMDVLSMVETVVEIMLIKHTAMNVNARQGSLT